MNKNTVLLLLIFILPLIAYFYLSYSGKSEAVSHSAPSAKIIKFTSTMCGECKRVDEVIKQVYPKYEDKTGLISINVQNGTKYNNEMMAQYRITLVPTIILKDKNGEIYKRIEGYIDAETFDKYLKELTDD